MAGGAWLQLALKSCLFLPKYKKNKIDYLVFITYNFFMSKLALIRIIIVIFVNIPILDVGEDCL